ncbi:MAG TPA: thioredoxin-dependent thiol peroxidase [Gemmatimonadales bacterium]|nr:thioredoxin-dependent thiol peroxidase [Gemmatimonadales bacterium]
MAAIPTVGRKAPAFSTTDDAGQAVRLADLAGKTVVLYFYPKDDTSGCTTQACEFRDAWGELQAKGVVVLGVSPDSQASHQKFRAKHDLPFPLLMDTDHAIAEAYGVWGEKSMYGRKYWGILRTTFVIDGTGVIRHVFEKVKPAGHAEAILAVVG